MKAPDADDGHAAAEPAALADLRVLVVEDEANTRAGLRRLLEGSGAKVMAVGSTAEALEAVLKALLIAAEEALLFSLVFVSAIFIL